MADQRSRFPVHLPRLASGKPLRYLGRRIVQAMAANAAANFLLAERTVPGKFAAIRLAASDDERAQWEQEFAESREAIEQEVLREVASRHYRLRSPLAMDLFVVTETDLNEEPFSPAAVAGSRGLDGVDLRDLPAKLREHQEVILTRRTRAVLIESEPPGAAVYVDGRQMERVTPCLVNDLDVGSHALRLALPGYTLSESQLQVEPESGGRQRHLVRLEAEPPMALVEVKTFPARAAVRIGDEQRESPASFRLPAGPHRIEVALSDYAPASLPIDLPAADTAQPQRVALKLEYTGLDREEPVGRLLVYAPDGSRAQRPQEPPNAVAAFFGDGTSVPDETPVAGQRDLFRGILVIGRDDPRETVRPDVRLRDPGNTVSRGCHAWLHIYSDPGTGADYNTFVIHNNSSQGIRVDGRVVNGSTALSDDSVVEVGVFKMRILKATPGVRVEL